MKALVFAAGVGSRLKPFTDFHPKALAPVAGVPMLQRVLERLRAVGIRNVVVNVHHFSNQIREFLSANEYFGMNIKISDESSCLLDTGGGLLKAKDLLCDGDDEPILLHNADILTDASIAEMLAEHNRVQADATLLTSVRKTSRLLYFDTTSGLLRGWCNLNTGVSEPTAFNPNEPSVEGLAFGGVHIVQPSIFSHLDEYAVKHGNVFSITPFYLSVLDRMRIANYTPEKIYKWFDIGTTEKLAVAERSFVE